MNYVDIADKYAQDVIKGEISACSWIKKACKRYKKDRKRKDIYMDDKRASKWCRFLEKLPHVKGKWAFRHEALVLSDWQVFIIVNVYGFYWKRNGRRRFREVFILVPRKNGKSFMLAGVGLGHLAIDEEYGAEVYTGATTEKQAWEVFRPARQMAIKAEGLADYFGIEVNAKNLNVMNTGSRFEPVIGKPGDGSSPSCGIVDEYHEHADSDMVDTFQTGMGARENPVLWQISTAGTDMASPCYDKQDEVKKILDGSITDDTIFGMIYTIDEKDKWDTVEAQIKANPNYGISVDEEFLAAQLSAARRSARKQSAYKTKHLNLWVGAKSAWMNMLAYQKCRKKIDILDYTGRRCYLGIDLASKIDIASLVAYFPDDGVAFARHYLPEDRIEEGGYTKYKAWAAEGWIIPTPGNVIDYGYIEDDLEEIKSLFQIEEVAYDPFQATQFSVRMSEKGFPMVEVGATVKNFSEPMKELEALILKKGIKFDMDPVLNWMFSNVVAKLDKKDNIFPDKEKKENKIDGVIALLMALKRSIDHKNDGRIDDFLSDPVVLS